MQSTRRGGPVWRKTSNRAQLSTSSLSSLDPYPDYVGVNISLNNSSSVSCLNVYALPIRSSPTDGRTVSFSPFILPSFRNLFILGDLNCHHSLWDSKVTSDPRGEEVAPLLTSPLPPLLLPFPAPGRCYRTLVLTTYQFFYLSLSLRSFAPASAPLSSIFKKLAGITLLPSLTFTVPQQRNTRLILFPLLLLFSPLWH